MSKALILRSLLKDPDSLDPDKMDYWLEVGPVEALEEIMSDPDQLRLPAWVSYSLDAIEILTGVGSHLLSYSPKFHYVMNDLVSCELSEWPQKFLDCVRVVMRSLNFESRQLYREALGRFTPYTYENFKNLCQSSNNDWPLHQWAWVRNLSEAMKLTSSGISSEEVAAILRFNTIGEIDPISLTFRFLLTIPSETRLSLLHDQEYQHPSKLPVAIEDELNRLHPYRDVSKLADSLAQESITSWNELLEALQYERLSLQE